jgi:hypothetical protein
MTYLRDLIFTIAVGAALAAALIAAARAAAVML